MKYLLESHLNTAASWCCLVILMSVFLQTISTCFAQTPGEKNWTLGELKFPSEPHHPLIACSAVELERLRAAYQKASGEEYKLILDVVAAGKKAVLDPLTFPERGGQHNQWYQCDKCQMALTTIDDTHHKCPKCGTIYSGAPYDDVIFAHKHNSNLHRMREAAWAWAIAGDKTCADFSANVLLGYAERYENYPYHDNYHGTKVADKTGGHLMEQTLDESAMLSTDIAPAFDLIYDTLSEAQRKKIATGLILPMLKNIDKNKANKSNWQTWHNAAMLAGGAVLHDRDWITKALTQPGNGFVSQMETSVTDDGMWYENSWGYHFYTLTAMVIIAEDARRIGVDVWSHPRFKKMFTLPAHYTMADGSLPRLGDDVQSSAQGAPERNEPAYAVYKDESILALLPAKPNFQSVLLGRDVTITAGNDVKKSSAKISDVFKSAGQAILRSNGEMGITAALAFGPYGGYHGHFDKLSFVLFANGEELGVDPGRAQSQAYRLPIHNNWYKATISHNAMLVDGRTQYGVAGKLDLFAANASFTAVRASCDKAFTDIADSRLLVLTPEYLLVIDEAADRNAQAVHHFDWIYHGKGKSVSCPDVTEPASEIALHDFYGKEYLQKVRSASSDKLIQVQFETGKTSTWVTCSASPATQIFLADGPFRTVDDRVPMCLFKRATGSFAVVLEPVASGAKPTVSNVEIDTQNGVTSVTITRIGGQDVVQWSAHSPLQIKRDNTVVLTGTPETAEK